jgi:hypothetical protein
MHHTSSKITVQVWLGKPIANYFISRNYDLITTSPIEIRDKHFTDCPKLVASILMLGDNIMESINLPYQVQLQSIDMIKEINKHDCVSFHKVIPDVTVVNRARVQENTAHEIRALIKCGHEVR